MHKAQKSCEKTIPVTKRNLQRLVGKEFFLMYLSTKDIQEGNKRDLEAGVDKDLVEQGRDSSMGYAIKVARRDSSGLYTGKLGFGVVNIKEEDGSEFENEEKFHLVDITSIRQMKRPLILEGLLYRSSPYLKEKYEPLKKIYLEIQGIDEHPISRKPVEFLG